MSRKIVFTSGKGGVGKTTICANVGLGLAKLKNRVVMIDADIGLNNLDVMMGVENTVLYDIFDVVTNKCRLKQALIQDFRCPSLYTLPSKNLFNEKRITSYDIKNVVDTLAKSFDYVLIDCPAGIDSGFHRAVFCADEAIVVTTPHLSSVRDADKVVSVLNSYRLSQICLVVNRIRGDLVVSGEMMSSETIANLLKIKLIGIIPDNDDISFGVLTKKENSDCTNALRYLCENIHYNFNKKFDYTSKYLGFFGGIKRSLKRNL